MCVPSEQPFLTWQCLSTDTGYTCHQVRDADVDVLGQTPQLKFLDRPPIKVWMTGRRLLPLPGSIPPWPPFSPRPASTPSQVFMIAIVDITIVVVITITITKIIVFIPSLQARTRGLQLDSPLLNSFTSLLPLVSLVL